MVVPFSEIEGTEESSQQEEGEMVAYLRQWEFRVFLDHLRACVSNRHLNMSI